MSQEKEHIQVIQGDEADILRQMYISSFVMTKSAYYHQYIETIYNDDDGPFYTGYLWDTLKQWKRISLFTAKDYIETRTQDIYVFWDIHSATRIFIPEYWKYPKNAVLKIPAQAFEALLDTLPEDIYIFDDSLSWSVIFTHEELKPGRRICLYCSE